MGQPNPMIRIREQVFRVNQIAMAEIAGVAQSTVSRWENGEAVPDLAALRRIREEAARRGLMWHDSFFFEQSGA